MGIVDLGRTLGWRVAHFKPVLASYPGARKQWMTPVAADGKGFPDLLLVRERVIAVEVKGDGDRLRSEQQAWLDAFGIAGIETFVWTPKQWGPAGEIETELKRRHRRYPAIREDGSS